MSLVSGTWTVCLCGKPNPKTNERVQTLNPKQSEARTTVSGRQALRRHSFAGGGSRAEPPLAGEATRNHPPVRRAAAQLEETARLAVKVLSSTWPQHPSAWLAGRHITTAPAQPFSWRPSCVCVCARVFNLVSVKQGVLTKNPAQDPEGKALAETSIQKAGRRLHQRLRRLAHKL